MDTIQKIRTTRSILNKIITPWRRKKSMWYSRLIIAVFVFSLIATSFANASPTLCDYYDLYGEFIITFPKDTVLGKSGPSATIGISFIFPDKSTLKIFPGVELYDPLYADPDSDASRPDDVNFVRKHAQNGCRVSKNEQEKKTKITCKNYEYTIIAADNQKYRTYIRIYYDFKSKKYNQLYHSIVNSLVLVTKDQKDKFKFYDAARQAIAEYYYAQDAAYQKRVDAYQIPDIVCGSYRIRDKMLQKP